MKPLDLIANFPELLEEACKWATDVEKWILAHGFELSEHQLRDAQLMQVRAPERIRVLFVPHIPSPDHGLLKLANERVRFITENTAGLTLRYGIFIRAEFRTDRDLLLHEFVHVEQYERLGGFKQFLAQYLTECLTLGYANAPLEKEAVDRSGRPSGRSR